ncbi:hypothetical protein VTO42DRAFT_5316 [Malbranchea cinnamomea]
MAFYLSSLLSIIVTLDFPSDALFDPPFSRLRAALRVSLHTLGEAKKADPAKTSARRSAKSISTPQHQSHASCPKSSIILLSYSRIEGSIAGKHPSSKWNLISATKLCTNSALTSIDVDLAIVLLFCEQP